MTTSGEDRKSLIRRLRRVQGQLQGIERMLDEERNCPELIIQLLAARAALDQVGRLLLEKEMEHCLGQSATPEEREGFQEALRLWARLG